MRNGIAVMVISFFAIAHALSAVDYYVAPGGNDANPGTSERPFRTIQKAADIIQAGDTCYVRGGVYREIVTVKRGGAEGKPVRFVAYPGEVVTLNGTEPIDATWRMHKGAVHKAQVDREFEQLFVNGKMMIEARWPNATFEEMLDRSKWAHAHRGSRYGKLVDPELAKTGIDWTGALGVLNLTHQFYTWTRFVTEHEAGRDHFSYPKDFGKMTEMRYATKSWPWEDDRYYLAGVLLALDAPGEWHLDRQTRTLYLWPPKGCDPKVAQAEAKARDLAFVVRDQDYVEIEGFHFFAATFSFSNANHCTVDNCHLLFPLYTRELTDLLPKPRRKNALRTAMVGDYNVVRNTSIAYTPTSGLTVNGRQTRIENCYVHDLCWSGSLRYGPISTSPGPKSRRSTAPLGTVVRRNTVCRFGNSGVNYRNQPSIIELNHVYDGGLACKDVALIYTGQPSCAGSIVRHNWAHGCRTEEDSGLGIRGDDQTRSLTVHHNVVWDCGRDGIIIKGDHNKVHNNTCLYIGTKSRLGNSIAMPVRKEPTKPWRKQHPLLSEQNRNSAIYNNAARTIAGNQSKRTPFPWPKNLSHNYMGEAFGLVAPTNLDFRPKPGSPLINAGREIPGFTDGFKGKAPDVGAYEFGGEHWKPGHCNGVWVVAGESGMLKIALTMPPLRPVVLQVQPGGARLRFTERDWMEPKTAKLANARRITLTVDGWGTVELADLAQLRKPAGAKLWFPEPDIVLSAAPDRRFNTDYFPAKSIAQSKTSLKPVARAFKTDRPPLIDGRVSRNEWAGWSPARRLLLRPLGTGEERTETAGEAYALFDDDALYIAARIRGRDAPALLRTGGEWGQTDGVEVDIQPVLGGKLGPIFVLHGFPSGKFESVTDAGATETQARVLGEAVDYAAQTAGMGWTCEFKIPLTSLLQSKSPPTKFLFNVGCRVGRDAGEWFAWAKTRGANYNVGGAGELVLTPACPAAGEDLLHKGTFESSDAKPWHMTANRGVTFPDGSLRRVREAADGSWCMKWECKDEKLMQKGILKWLHALPKDIGPGTYLLSYDMRVEDLTPRAKGSMFCGYIRTVAKPTGRNEGQTPHAFSGKALPWTRRDCVIEIPKSAKPSYVSLQLHKATGTVWVDNVALVKCE